MKNENTRNMVIFAVCTAVILILYQVFYMGPVAAQRKAMQEAAACSSVWAAAASCMAFRCAATGPM